jgi:hypothetical protein
VTNVQDAPAQMSHHRTNQQRRRGTRFRPKQSGGGV